MSVPAGVTILLVFSKILELRDFMEIHLVCPRYRSVSGI